MIVMVTDFGWRGPYVGQLQAVLFQKAPGVPVIDLFNDMPTYNPRTSSHLLAAYIQEFVPGTVFLVVVDPGVGNEARRPVIVNADGRWFVGPGNGIFDVVMARASDATCHEILWRPQHLSATFHGRDLFAPVAAMLSIGQRPETMPLTHAGKKDAAEDLAEVVYLDHFGNAMTGIRASNLARDDRLVVNGRTLDRARTFSDVGIGEPFWYENANGLAEIAVNQGNAQRALQLNIGTTLEVR